jgi:hypothetical protein
MLRSDTQGGEHFEVRLGPKDLADLRETLAFRIQVPLGNHVWKCISFPMTLKHDKEKENCCDDMGPEGKITGMERTLECLKSSHVLPRSLQENAHC